MDPKKKAITAAVLGTALGAAGLAVIAMPAGAGEAPQLPPVSAEDLVQSVLTAQTPAFEGTVKVDNALGLPALPGVPSLDLDSARIYNDGAGASRLSLQQGSSEQTVVRNGETVWKYDSGKNTATKITVPADALKDKGVHDGEVTDPTAAAADLVNTVRETSTVSVEGTARVADRPAYEVVLTPKPDERTLLREVRVSIDAEKRVPLRLAVLANGSADPALQIAYTDVSFAPQPADRFNFTPPQGAKVTEKQADVNKDKDWAKERDAQGKDKAMGDTTVVGTGWDTVVTGKFSPESLQGGQQPADKDKRGWGNWGDGDRGQGQGAGFDPKALLDQVSKPVTGPFGTGHVISLKVGTALITDDGRFAAGAVPEQVLIEALGNK
ncbi:LolA family protein [Amycolatopsis nigrescens]|uniref:LolA family protein n=1 Tax=Amycolatopsis nigrescens TaxID=381445 RepID=UPI0003817103|nr:sigma-E factor regulatory protein RseB domain-containing protein [Amycolatopsis nigrescens]